MFKKNYFLNPETLRYEQISYPFWKRLRRTSTGFFILLLISAGLRLGYEHFADSPKVLLLIEQNQQLKSSYQFLNDQIDRSEKLLTELQKWDDQFYRAILDVTPVPRSIRDAGVGGSENLSDLLLNRSADFVVTSANQLEKLASRVKMQSLSLGEISEMAYHKKRMIAGIPSIQPIAPSDSFWLSSTFGVRSDPFTRGRRMHPGIDLAGRRGLQIYATGDGLVKEAAASRNGYGREILIDHGYGYKSRYAHLHKILVKPGEKVKRGQLIGLLGSTGRSTGPHLHYEVLYYGKPMNPMYFFYENLKPDEFSLIVSQASSK